MSKPGGLWSRLGPGVLVAATGVGAGDLATAALAGSRLGTGILWAVVVGACFKWLLNEGVARWQLTTGTTVLEGVTRRIGRWAISFFAAYLLLWTFWVGSVLMSACGVAAHALVPVFEDASEAKRWFGAGHGVLGVALVLAGGFRLFERVMGVCIAAMCAIVVWTAWCVVDDPVQALMSVVRPDTDALRGDGLTWTVALIGGVGGTVTILCYGYWLREKGWGRGEGDGGSAAIRRCRLDLAVGYLVTAIFGVAMVILGSELPVDGKGARLIVELADRLEEPMGPVGRWMFLVGAWGAVFSSLLGVWQSVPYLLVDTAGLVRQGAPDQPLKLPDASGAPYRVALAALAVVPMGALWIDFVRVQKLYAVLGACFVPFLALALLRLTGRRELGALRSGVAATAGLAATCAFFLWLWFRSL